MNEQLNQQLRKIIDRDGIAEVLERQLELARNTRTLHPEWSSDQCFDAANKAIVLADNMVNRWVSSTLPRKNV